MKLCFAYIFSFQEILYTRILFALVALFFLSGCGSTVITTSDPYDRQKFQERTENRSVRLILNSGRIINAGSLQLSADSLFFMQNGIQESIAVDDLDRMEIKGKNSVLSIVGAGLTGAGIIVAINGLNSDSVNGAGNAGGGLLLTGPGFLSSWSLLEAAEDRSTSGNNLTDPFS